MKHATVLVVDRDTKAQAAIAHVLREEGHVVLLAACGERALELARTARAIEVLIAAMSLEGLTSHELALFFAVLHPHAAVVFLSDGAERTPPGLILRKPLDVDELRAIVGRAIENADEYAFGAPTWPWRFSGSSSVP